MSILQLNILQGIPVRPLLIMLLLCPYPVLQLHILLSQFVQQILVQADHVLGLFEVTPELIVFQVPPVCLSFCLPYPLIHVFVLSLERFSALFQSFKLGF